MDGYFDIEVYLISEYSKTTMHTFCYLSRFLFSSTFAGVVWVLYECMYRYRYLSRAVAEIRAIVSKRF
jgi:hypothetical protein